MSKIDGGGFDGSCIVWRQIIRQSEHVSRCEWSRGEVEDRDMSEDLGDEDSSDENSDEDDERSEMTMAFDSAWEEWIRLE